MNISQMIRDMEDQLEEEIAEGNIPTGDGNDVMKLLAILATRWDQTLERANQLANEKADRGKEDSE